MGTVQERTITTLSGEPLHALSLRLFGRVLKALESLLHQPIHDLDTSLIPFLREGVGGCDEPRI